VLLFVDSKTAYTLSEGYKKYTPKIQILQ